LIPFVGERDLLLSSLGKQKSEDMLLRLFVNDIFPNELSEGRDFVELEGAGYAPKKLIASEWVVDELAVYPMQTFDFTGRSAPVYGYYVTRQKSGVLILATRFSDGPYEIDGPRAKIRITPRIGRQGLSKSVVAMAGV